MPPLIERDRAVAALAAALDSIASGSGRLISIEGDAGTGKSRLLDEAERLAGERAIVAQRASGLLIERPHPFGLMQRLLERPVAGLSDEELESMRSGAPGPALDLFTDARPAAPPADALHALVVSCFRLVARLADRGSLLLAIDDLPWADQASAQVIAHLAARLDELPLALAVATRDGEELAGPDPRTEVRARPALTEVRVEPLSEDGSRRLLDSLLGHVGPGLGASAFAATAGNPFMLVEVAAAVARSGAGSGDGAGAELATAAPTNVRRWVARRLDQLGPGPRALAVSLAVLEQAELRVAGEHAGLDAEDARAAADRLAAAGLAAGSLPLRFAHPLVRAAIYDGLPPGERDHAHHEAARVLARRRAPPDAVASHLLLCEPRGEAWAIAALRASASTALARGAADQAAATLARAAAEPDGDSDPGLLVELGRARAAINDPEAVADLERAAAAVAEPATRIAALSALAQARYLAGDIGGAFAGAGEALAEIPPGTGGNAEAELLLGYLMAGRQSPRLLVATREELRRPRRGPGPAPAPAEIVRRQVIGLDAFLRGEHAGAAEHSRWVGERIDEQEPGGELPPLLAIGPAFVLAGIGEWERSEALIAANLDLARRRGSPLETAECLHERSWLRWRRGDVLAGLDDVETVLELTAGAWDAAKVPLLVARAHLLLEREETEAAAATLALPAELERSLPGTWGWPWLAIARAEVALALGRPGEALAQALAAGRRLAEIDADSPEYAPWRSLAARAAARVGDGERALELAGQERDLGERIGAPRAVATGLSALASAAPRGQRSRLLGEAAAAFDRARSPLQRGHALLALGIELRRERAVRDAREPLREALEIGHRCDSLLLSGRALAELRASGGRPRRERTSGVDALTPREREIAGLAADGLGNVEIAERLFITRKTVEGHLRTIFRKLGVSSRDQLKAALDR